METWAYFSLKLVHLAAMALWVGGPPIAAHGFHESVREGPAFALAATRRLRAVTPLFIGAALATLASGGGLLWVAGPSAVPGRILAGAALTLPIFAIGGAVVRPTLQKLDAIFQTGSIEGAEPLVRRFLLAHRSEQAIRVAVLCLMVLRF